MAKAVMAEQYDHRDVVLLKNYDSEKQQKDSQSDYAVL